MHVEKCPVCNGNGMVPGGFYTQVSGYWWGSVTSELCQSCGGKGYIFVPDEQVELDSVQWNLMEDIRKRNDNSQYKTLTNTP
jgi:DnaJ-class molecular chaperone